MVAQQLRDRGVRSDEVLDAMGRVPRQRFVDPSMANHAYEDRALGIASGQTISQPYMVARMTEALDLPGWRERHPDVTPRVLDVGTGSGYQAAVLAEMGTDVVSIEREPRLAEEARERLEDLGYERGGRGRRRHRGPSAACPLRGHRRGGGCPGVPLPLVEQLEEDGRLIIPVGQRDQQWLTVVTPAPEGYHLRESEPCVFVPLVGRYGFRER